MVVLVRRRLICKERLASIMNFLEEVEVPWIRKRHVKRKLFDLRCSAPYTIWDMGQTGQYIGKAESVCFRSLQKQICPRAILGKAAFVNEYSILKAVSQGTWARSQLHAEIAVIPLNKISWQQLGQKQKDCLLQFRACSSWGLDPSDIDLPERLAAAAAAASKFFKFQGATSVTSWIHLMGGHLAFHLGWPRRQWHVRDVKNLRDVGACKFGSGMLCLIPLELTRGCCCYSFSGFHDGGIWESLWNHAICTQMITSPNPSLQDCVRWRSTTRSKSLTPWSEHFKNHRTCGSCTESQWCTMSSFVYAVSFCIAVLYTGHSTKVPGAWEEVHERHGERSWGVNVPLIVISSEVMEPGEGVGGETT